MSDNLEQQLRTVLSDLPEVDVHAVAAFAEFLTQRRHKRGTDRSQQLTDSEHERIIAALDDVASLTLEDGPDVSNRDHDGYLYGGER
jgi:hypothetical protein